MFNFCNSKEEAKKVYRKLALKLHPDCGGDHELMKLLQDHYDQYNSWADNHIKENKKDGNFNSKPKQEEKEKILESDERISVLYDLMDLCKQKRLKAEDFIFSVYEFFEEKKFITTAQYQALSNIYKYASVAKN